jgi:hypothetical protein
MAEITYTDGTPPEVVAFEELFELQEIIERGPNWNVIERIEVTLNIPSSVAASGAGNFAGADGSRTVAVGKASGAVGSAGSCPMALAWREAYQSAISREHRRLGIHIPYRLTAQRHP